MERTKSISIQLLFGLPSHRSATGLGRRVWDVTKDVCDVTAAEAWLGWRLWPAREVLDVERAHLLQGAIHSACRRGRDRVGRGGGRR